MKQLEKDLQQVEAELREAKLSRSMADRQIQSLTTTVNDMKKQLAAVPKELEFTDHAIVQYLRRPMEQDIDCLVIRIRNLVSCKVGLLGDGEYPIGEGHRAVVKDNKVVTIK